MATPVVVYKRHAVHANIMGYGTHNIMKQCSLSLILRGPGTYNQ